MQRNAAVPTTVCIMMLFTLNYTFPLLRKSSDSVEIHSNQSQHLNIPARHATIVERSKKMASNLESAFKRFTNTTKDFGRNIYDHVSTNLKQHITIINDEDLRNFEKMVIMKKYPYLDSKELEYKYHPLKHIRQNLNVEQNLNSGDDPGIREYLEENPNVEVTNRGLSGFAFPLEHSKPSSMSGVSDVEPKAAKYASNNNDNTNDKRKVNKKNSSVMDVLGSLKNGVRQDSVHMI